jgi:hypothetical protein
MWNIRARCFDSGAKECAYACNRSFMFNSYLTRIFVCNTVVRREISSVLDAGVDSSVGNEEGFVIAVGEPGAEPEGACRLSEERVLMMFVAFLSAVRKSSANGLRLSKALAPVTKIKTEKQRPS